MSALATVAPRQRAVGEVVRDWIALTKPRIIVLLEITTFFAMIAAQRGWPSWRLVVATLAGGWLAASGANVINCWFDRDIDRDMARTRRRPLPDGRIAPSSALTFGIVLGVAAFVLLATEVNLLAAVLAEVGLLFYVLVYTMWLKRSSVQNIVVGGAAGAIPPLVGWAAVTGRIDLGAIFLFAIVFYWTPPHFWALALLIRRDYAAASVPMLPVVAGDDETRRQIVLYSIILVVVSILPGVTRTFGVTYLVGALILGAIFIAGAVRTARSGSSRDARQLFYYSMIYLALIFGLVAVDRIIS
jgi:protoheme IX farnesyltransferase